MGDQTNHENKSDTLHNPSKLLESIGWGLFFVWVGISVLGKFHIGVGLMGIGVITLGGQAARVYYKLKPDGFWVVVGLLFLLGGIGELFQKKIDLLPILLIAAGAVVMLSIFKHRKEQKE